MWLLLMVFVFLWIEHWRGEGFAETNGYIITSDKCQNHKGFRDFVIFLLVCNLNDINSRSDLALQKLHNSALNSI